MKLKYKEEKQRKTPKKEPLILIVGRSGSGKTTIANKLSEKYGMKQVISLTDRPKRNEQEAGHIFVSTEEMLDILKKSENAGENLEDRIVGYTFFDQHHYCARMKDLDGKAVYVIDPKGIELLKSLDFVTDHRQLITVGIAVSDDERQERMLKRGDSKEKVQERIQNDKDRFQNLTMISNYIFCNEKIGDLGFYDKDTVESIAEEIYKIYKGAKK